MLNVLPIFLSFSVCPFQLCLYSCLLVGCVFFLRFFFLKKFYFMLAFLSQWTDTDERNQIEGNASIGLLFSLDKKIGNCFCVIYTENINILYPYGSTAFYRYVKMPSSLARQVSVELDSMPPIVLFKTCWLCAFVLPDTIDIVTFLLHSWIYCYVAIAKLSIY